MNFSRRITLFIALAFIALGAPSAAAQEANEPPACTKDNPTFPCTETCTKTSYFNRPTSCSCPMYKGTTSRVQGEVTLPSFISGIKGEMSTVPENPDDDFFFKLRCDTGDNTVPAFARKSVSDQWVLEKRVMKAHWSGRNIPGQAVCPTDYVASALSVNLADDKAVALTCYGVVPQAEKKAVIEWEGEQVAKTGAWTPWSECSSKDMYDGFISGIKGQYDSHHQTVTYWSDCDGTDFFLPKELPTIIQPEVDTSSTAPNPLRAVFVEPLSAGSKTLTYNLVFEGESAWVISDGQPQPHVDALATDLYHAHNYLCWSRTSDIETFQVDHTGSKLTSGSYAGPQDWSSAGHPLAFIIPGTPPHRVIVLAYVDTYSFTGQNYTGDIYVVTPNHLLDVKPRNSDVPFLQNTVKWTDGTSPNQYELFYGGHAEANTFAQDAMPDRSKSFYVKLLRIKNWDC